MPRQALIDKLNALLPQTQCTKCGFDGCLPYATAIADGQAPINRCPPGGEAGIVALAQATGQAPIPLDRSCGEHRPLHWAHIDEQHCIGCTLCIRACPVDAIVGVNKFMHSVISDLCTGCDLCVPVCPVDCIRMLPAPTTWGTAQAQAAQQRHQRRQRRQAQWQTQETQRLQQASLQRPTPQDSSATPPTSAKAAAIAMALAKARARRQS